MAIFAAKFKILWTWVRERVVHPFPAMTWVHQKIGEIHPFDDVNGRISRVSKDLVLQLGGIKGFPIPNDDDYTKAITQDQKVPGTIIKYFLGIYNWANRQKELAP